MKTCPKCEVVRPEADFNRHHRICKACRAETQRAYVERNRPKIYERNKAWRDQGGRERSKLALYGITPEDYARMMDEQGGVCAICRGVCPSGRKLAVDHDHDCCDGLSACGQCVRGLLCARCNAGIAYFLHDPHIVVEAMWYLATRKTQMNAPG